MNNPHSNSKPIVEKEQKQSFQKHIVSFGMGILAIWPYLLIAISANIDRPSEYSTSAFHLFLSFFSFFTIFFAINFGFISGIPFGIAGIILSIRNWRGLPKNKINVVFAAISILLSIGGIIGHVWFFVFCVYCQ